MKKGVMTAIILIIIIILVALAAYLAPRFTGKITGNVISDVGDNIVTRTITGNADSLQVTLNVNSNSYAIGISEVIPYLCNAYAVSEQGVIKTNTIEWLFAPAKNAKTLSYKLNCPDMPKLSGEWYTIEDEGTVTDLTAPAPIPTPNPIPTPMPVAQCTNGDVKYFNCTGRANPSVNQTCVNGTWETVIHVFKVGYSICSCEKVSDCSSGYNCTNKVCTKQTTPTLTGNSLIVNKVFKIMLERNASSGELTFWVDAMSKGWTKNQIAFYLYKDKSFQTKYNVAGKSNSDFVEFLCQKILFRACGAGKVSYVTSLGKGTTRESVAKSFIDTAEFNTKFANYK